MDGSWHFPSRNGGIDFIQDPSSAHFSDDPIPKMVREVIQNSLDARQPGRDTHPIVVKFTDTEVPKELIGANDLSDHVAACLDRATKQSHSKVAKMYENALRTLNTDPIRCLRITDSTTTGLLDTKWDALVVQEGAVKKSSQGAPGGSYGIGKNAVFNVSDIRTVFYSTKYVDEEREGLIAKLQGKATLMSHPNPKGEHESLQHIGFYTSSDKRALFSKDIAPFFQLKENGTGVFIMGFNPRSDDWTRDVQAAVIENFFHAIHHKRLQVHISSPSIAAEIKITFETIDHLFNSSPGSGTPDAYHYYLAIRDEDRASTPKIGKFGALSVYVRTEGGPRRTAYVNRNGMLITASREQNINPIAPRGKGLWPDYAAVVTPSDDSGDRWIRDMEPPSHDSISPRQLDDPDDRRLATSDFVRARRAIRELIDSKAEIEKFGDTSNLKELADVFPDEFDPASPGNRALYVHQIDIDRRLRERPREYSAESEAVGTIESDEIQSGGRPDEPEVHHGGGQPSGGTSAREPGDNEEMASRARAQASVRPPAISNPRVIHIGDREAILGFTSQRDEPDRCCLTLMPAGEDSEAMEYIRIEQAVCVNDQDTDVEVDNGRIFATLRAGQRVLVRVITKEPISDLALRLG